MPSLETFLVLKLLKSRLVNNEQPENILYMSVKCEVLKVLKSKFVNDLQEENI